MAIVNKVDELQGKQAEMLAILKEISYEKVDRHIESKVVADPSLKVFLKKLSKIVLWQVKNNV